MGGREEVESGELDGIAFGTRVSHRKQSLLFFPMSIKSLISQPAL